MACRPSPAITWAQGVPVELPDWFEQTMRTQFIFASVLYDAHPGTGDLAVRLAEELDRLPRRVLGCSCRVPRLLALLTARVKATANGTTFVPYLSRTVYGDLARAYVAEARQYETDFRALQTQRVVDDHFLALAKTLLPTRPTSEYAPSCWTRRSRTSTMRSRPATRPREPCPTRS